jgi:hypothetical protein
MTILNDATSWLERHSRVINYAPRVINYAPRVISYAPRVINHAPRVNTYPPSVSITLIENIYGTGVTHDDCHMIMLICL